MKKVMLKKPKTKEFLAAAFTLGGVYYLAYSTTNSVSIGLLWTSVTAIAGALGIIAMKVFANY